MLASRASPRRSPSVTSIGSTGSSWSDLDNTTTGSFEHAAAEAAVWHRCPSSQCPLAERGRQNSTSSVRSCEDMSSNETRDLWLCMLDLQKRYGCYNSTRIDLALGAGDDAINLMPNRFIIDTLNNSLRDLPDEGWNMLFRCLEQEVVVEKEKPKRRFWARN
ncbi:hypothetical protein K4F52_000355 [Lecanicillium sp. MT-2017a]|nr:hypothetical protein K4F52_000355 [Lecanicillium sp. MT-2017a]